MAPLITKSFSRHNSINFLETLLLNSHSLEKTINVSEIKLTLYFFSFNSLSNSFSNILLMPNVTLAIFFLSCFFQIPFQPNISANIRYPSNFWGSSLKIDSTNSTLFVSLSISELFFCFLDSFLKSCILGKSSSLIFFKLPVIYKELI